MVAAIQMKEVEHELKTVEISDGYMGTDSVIDFSLYIYVLFCEQFFKKKVQHMRIIPDAINQN